MGTDSNTYEEESEPVSSVAATTGGSAKEWVYVDADNRKKVPEGMHCERCKKEMNGSDKAVSVQLSTDGLFARKKQFGGHVIGADCWDKLIKEYGFQDIEPEYVPSPTHSETVAKVEGELAALKALLADVKENWLDVSQGRTTCNYDVLDRVNTALGEKTATKD